MLRSGQAPLSIAPKLEKVFELFIQQIESCVFYYEKLPDGTAKDRLGWHLEREYLEEVWYVAAFQSKRIPLTYHWLGITGSGVRKLKPFIRKLENLAHDGK